MPTTTPRLLLTKPLTTEFYDVAVHNNNMDLLDAAPGNAVICTSATRPAAPHDGDEIFESDSSNFLVRHSSTWKAHNAKTHICTSGTRPASGLTFGGFTIFETDTGNRLMRDAANANWLAQTGYSVASQAARDALTGVVEGMVIYRRDRDWLEAYDGTGWRVQGVAVCTSVADRDSAITTFYNGLKAVTLDTGLTWTLQAGSWFTMPMGVIGGRTITGLNNLGAAIGGTETMPTNMNSGSVNLFANQRYRIHVRFKAQASNNQEDFLLRVKEGTSAGTTGNDIRQYVYRAVANTLGYTFDMFVDYEPGASAVTRFFSLTAILLNGTGTIQFQGGNTGSQNPVGVFVEHVGSAGRLTVTAS